MTKSDKWFFGVLLVGVFILWWEQGNYASIFDTFILFIVALLAKWAAKHDNFNN